MRSYKGQPDEQRYDNRLARELSQRVTPWFATRRRVASSFKRTFEKSTGR